MNTRLRKVTRNRGQFTSEQATLKVLYLAVRNLEEFRGPNTGICSPGGNKRCRRSRSTSTGESRPHETATITYTDDRTLPAPVLYRLLSVLVRGHRRGPTCHYCAN